MNTTLKATVLVIHLNAKKSILIILRIKFGSDKSLWRQANCSKCQLYVQWRISKWYLWVRTVTV